MSASDFTRTVSRRRALGLAAALPLGMGLRVRPVLAGIGPKRVVFVYIPDGCIPSQWHPTGSEFDFALAPMTSPLESVREHCVFLSGLDMYEGGATHEGGIKKVLTGNGSQSLDTFLAGRIGGATSLSSLYLGVGASYQNGSGYFSELPGNIPRTPQDNPLAAFDSVFGGDVVARGPRLSVLDSALGDLGDLRARLGASERSKLDLHLDALREIEARISAESEPLGCNTSGFNPEGFTVPEKDYSYPPKFHREEHFELVGRLQMDLAVLALGCDMTRVVGLQWSHPVSPTRMAWTGSTQRHHDASHYGNAGSTTAANFVLLQQWYADRLRYLVEELDRRPDGDGTLLDNTLVLVFSELGDSNLHNHRNMPFILAGRGCGTLSTGRYLDYGGDAHTKLLVGIANAMDVPIDTFGYSGHGSGSLSGLFSV